MGRAGVRLLAVAAVMIWAIHLGDLWPYELRVLRAAPFAVLAKIPSPSLASARAFVPRGLPRREAIPGNPAGLLEHYRAAPVQVRGAA